MSELTFEPFQQVLVRDHNDQTWRAEHFSHMEDDGLRGARYRAGAYLWKQCIPYNDDTRHLLGTSNPHTTPVDEATRFKRGELVEIFSEEDEWTEAIYLRHRSTGNNSCNQHRVYDIGSDMMCTQPPHKIRKKQTSNA